MTILLISFGSFLAFSTNTQLLTASSFNNLFVTVFGAYSYSDRYEDSLVPSAGLTSLLFK